MAERRVTFSVQYEPGDFRDYAFYLARQRAQWIGPIAILGAAIAVISWSSDSELAYVVGTISSAAFGGAMTGLLMLFVVVPLQLPRRAARMTPGVFDTPFEWTLSEEGTAVTGPSASGQRAWASYSGAVATPKFLGLMAGSKNAMQFVPKRAVKPADFDAARAIVSAHLGLE